MNVKLHVACLVLDHCIRVCGAIVQQLGDGLGSGFGSLGLSGCESAECNQYGRVDGACVIQEGANNFLEAGDAGRVQRGRVIRWGWQLSGSSIVGGGPCMRGMLSSGAGSVLEFCKGFLDVAGHRIVDSAGFVIPLESEATVQGAGPIGGDDVQLLQGVDQMLGMFAAGILDAKVIDNQGESDWSGFVFRKRPGVCLVG